MPPAAGVAGAATTKAGFPMAPTAPAGFNAFGSPAGGTSFGGQKAAATNPGDLVPLTLLFVPVPMPSGCLVLDVNLFSL
jgi:hypothetical protein